MGTAARVRLSDGFPQAYAVEMPFHIFLLGRLKLFIVLLFVVSAVLFSLSARGHPEGRWAVMQPAILSSISQLEPRIHLTAIEAIFTDSNRDVLEREFLSRDDAASVPQMALSVATNGTSGGETPASNFDNQEQPSGSLNGESRFPPPTVLPNGDLMFSSAWNNGQTAQLPNDDMVMPTLIPGDGFTEPAETNLPAIGDPAAPGYDAKAIARWDVVPYQTFEGKFNVGVVAFHMNGIEKVSFSVNNGEWVDVYQMTLNPQTANHSGIGNASDGVVEYWATLDASLFQADGAVEVRAIAYPTVGVPRVLQGVTAGGYRPTAQGSQVKGDQSLLLYSNKQQTLSSSKVYVRPSDGDDSNSGAIDSPFATLKQALRRSANGQTIVLMESGRYNADRNAEASHTFTTNQRWITVEAAENVDPDQVIVTGNEAGPRSRLTPGIWSIRFHRVSLDWSTFVYVNSPNSWFDEVRVFDANGFAANYPTPQPPYANCAFVTDSSASDMGYGFANVQLARNAVVSQVCDAFQVSQAVINCHISAMDVGEYAVQHHPDVFQYFGNQENVIVYGITSAQLSASQGIFACQPIRAGDKLSNSAFVNITLNFSNAFFFSQLQGNISSVLFQNVNLGSQAMLLRSDQTNANVFSGSNVVFDSCAFLPKNFPLNTPLPAGVIIR